MQQNTHEIYIVFWIAISCNKDRRRGKTFSSISLRFNGQGPMRLTHKLTGKK